MHPRKKYHHEFLVFISDIGLSSSSPSLSSLSYPNLVLPLLRPCLVPNSYLQVVKREVGGREESRGKAQESVMAREARNWLVLTDKL